MRKPDRLLTFKNFIIKILKTQVKMLKYVALPEPEHNKPDSDENTHITRN